MQHTPREPRWRRRAKKFPVQRRRAADPVGALDHLRSCLHVSFGAAGRGTGRHVYDDIFTRI